MTAGVIFFPPGNSSLLTYVIPQTTLRQALRKAQEPLSDRCFFSDGPWSIVLFALVRLLFQLWSMVNRLWTSKLSHERLP